MSHSTSKHPLNSRAYTQTSFLKPSHPDLGKWSARGCPLVAVLTALWVITSSAWGATSLGEALDATSLAWVGESGKVAWTAQSSVTHDGVDAITAQVTGTRLSGPKAVIGTTLEGPGILSFWWKADRQSVAAGDPLIAGVGAGSQSLSSQVQIAMGTNLSGIWTKQQLAVPTGSQKVWWVLANGASSNVFTVKGWIDEIKYTKADTSAIADRSLAPGGHTLADWDGLYYKHLLEIPDDGHHPTKDFTGREFARAQSGSVWFLAGDWVGQVDTVRTGTLPGDKIIFLEAWGNECSSFEGDPYYGGTAAELKACVEKFTPTGTTLVEVDGYQIPNLSSYRVTSPVMPITLPSPNALGVPGTPTGISAANGLAVMITPLSPGDHVIRFGEPQNFITYKLTVTPPADGPPVILAEPQDATVATGGSVNLSTAASGVGPLRYQWLLNGTAPIAGGTNATLKLVGVQAGQLGAYSVVVSNSFGNATSRVAQVALKVPPSITQQPMARTNLIGTTASFTVAVAPTASLPVTYVWRKGLTRILTNTINERTCSLFLSNVTASAAADYSVVVSNPASTGVTSLSAHLYVVSSTSLPSTALTSPKEGQLFFAPATITLTSSANDTDGAIDHVDYYAGGSLIGTAYQPPYSLTWEHVASGDYVIIARGVDNVGGSGSSLPVNIRVLSTGVTPPGTAIGGIPYNAWQAKWWQWLYAMPTNEAPSLDSSGSRAQNGQSGPVWFLAGTSDNQKIDRHVVIPQGKHLFLPIINVINDYPCPDPDFIAPAGKSLEDFLSEFAASIIDTTTNLVAELDTIPITDFSSLRLRSGLFEFVGDPSWGAYDSCATNLPTSRAVSDGYWLMLDPLPPGEHVLRFSARDFLPGKDGQGNSTLSPFGNQDVTYHLTVLPTSFLPPSVPVAGRTQAEWSAVWWQWALMQPRSESPVFDGTGVKAGGRQYGDVFFLGGLIDYLNEESSVNRSFTVPAGKSLFFPLVASTADNVDVDPPLPIGELRGLISPGMDSVSELFATVDGVSVLNLQSTRQKSPSFAVILPQDNIYQSLSPGYQQGATIDPMVSDGYWVMLEPLPQGKHTVAFGGRTPFGTMISVTNEINVVGETVVPADATHLGKTIAEWSGEWWKWATSQPYEHAPIYDSNGELGHYGQHGPVWFLATVQANRVERSVIIPSGKNLFFPVLQTVALYPCSQYSLPPDQTVEQFLSGIVNSQIDGATTLMNSQVAELDGVPIVGLKSRRAVSPVVSFVADTSLTNGFAPCITGGRQDAVVGGTWAMLEPLSAGNHVLRFGARGDNGFYFDVIYHLTVLPPGVLPPKEAVANKSQEEWSAEWWKWAAAHGPGESPIMDATGSNANQAQRGSVFFLGSTLAPRPDQDMQAETRHFRVPAGKALFFPVLATQNNNLLYTPDVPADQLRQDAQSAMDDPVSLAVDIDGVGIPNLPLLRLRSPEFDLALPPGNFLSLIDPRYPEGSVVPSVISDGYWLMLSPLEPGTHWIDYRAKTRGRVSTAVRSFLTVVPAGMPFISDARRVGDHLVVTYWTADSGPHVVEAASDPKGPWLETSPAVAGDGEQHSVPIALNEPHRYFRIKVK